MKQKPNSQGKRRRVSKKQRMPKQVPLHLLASQRKPTHQASQRSFVIANKIGSCLVLSLYVRE
jgi:hypothetical protein